MSVDRSTSAAVGQTLFGQTEDGDLLPLDSILGQRQNTAFVLQQHNALGSGFADQSLMFGLVDRLLVGDLRVVETLLVFKEFQDVQRSVVDSLLGDFAGLDGLQDVFYLSPSRRPRHLEIETGVESRGDGVGSSPVAHD